MPMVLDWHDWESTCEETKQMEQDLDSQDVHPSLISFWIP